MLKITTQFMALAAVAVLASRMSSSAQDGVPSEYQLKAAFLYKFANFVTWPTNALGDSNDQFVIGVLGKDPFGKDFDVIRGQRLFGRTVEIRLCTDLAQVRGCHILFVSNSERKRLDDLVRALRDEPILTVSDMDQFAARGGMIHLGLVEGKIRFDINHSAARRAGLKVSSQLLRLATRIYGGEKDQ